MTAENSEDSNAQHSETDTKLEAPDKDNFEFTITDVISDSCDKKPDWSNEVFFCLYLYNLSVTLFCDKQIILITCLLKNSYILTLTLGTLGCVPR